MHVTTITRFTENCIMGASLYLCGPTMHVAKSMWSFLGCLKKKNIYIYIYIYFGLYAMTFACGTTCLIRPTESNDPACGYLAMASGHLSQC